jgi:hypothetical protein
MPKSGKYYVQAGAKNGLRVEPGKGDHVKVYGPAGRGYMTIPLHRELKKGLECSVRKWFKTLGILVLLVMPMACLLIALVA